MKRYAILASLLAAALAASFGAGLSVPEFGLITSGAAADDGSFELSTRVSLELGIEGGSKFAARFSLGFDSVSLEDYLAAISQGALDPDDAATGAELAAAIRRLEASQGLYLKSAMVAIPGAFGTPVDLGVFVGGMDTLGGGRDFPLLYGSAPFATKLRGFLYYPEGIRGLPGRAYDGLHQVSGTGLALSVPGERFTPYLYLYQDSFLGAGAYSADARMQYDGGPLKFEAFAGASGPAGSAGVYRAGFMFYFDTGSIGSFFAQAGVPRWDPSQAFEMSLFYFLFEPRFDFGAGELILTVFSHPGWYLQSRTYEEGFLELRADLGFGSLESGGHGGLETVLEYRTKSAADPDPTPIASPLSISLAPYYRALVSGVTVDLRLDVKLFPVPDRWYGFLAPALGISASF